MKKEKEEGYEEEKEVEDGKGEGGGDHGKKQKRGGVRKAEKS